MHKKDGRTDSDAGGLLGAACTPKRDDARVHRRSAPPCCTAVLHRRSLQEFAAWCTRLQLPSSLVPELFEALDVRQALPGRRDRTVRGWVDFRVPTPLAKTLWSWAHRLIGLGFTSQLSAQGLLAMG